MQSTSTDNKLCIFRLCDVKAVQVKSEISVWKSKDQSAGSLIRVWSFMQSYEEITCVTHYFFLDMEWTESVVDQSAYNKFTAIILLKWREMCDKLKFGYIVDVFIWAYEVQTI